MTTAPAKSIRPGEPARENAGRRAPDVTFTSRIRRHGSTLCSSNGAGTTALAIAALFTIMSIVPKWACARATASAVSLSEETSTRKAIASPPSATMASAAACSPATSSTSPRAFARESPRQHEAKPRSRAGDDSRFAGKSHRFFSFLLLFGHGLACRGEAQKSISANTVYRGFELDRKWSRAYHAATVNASIGTE